MYLLSLWEKGFATAAEPDENDAREAEGLRYELQQQEYALSQGSQQHLTYFNQQRGRLSDRRCLMEVGPPNRPALCSSR